MDYGKVTPDLALELHDVPQERQLQVFVWAKDEGAATVLAEGLGLEARVTDRGFAARLSAPAIAELSESSAVDRIELAGSSRFISAF